MADKTHRERMLGRELYYALGPELSEVRKKARALMKKFNASVGEECNVTLEIQLSYWARKLRIPGLNRHFIVIMEAMFT